MWMAVLYSVGAVAMAALEVPKLWKRKKKKELRIFAALFIAVTALGLAVNMRAPVPNPLDAIAIVIAPYARAIYSLFD